MELTNSSPLMAFMSFSSLTFLAITSDLSELSSVAFSSNSSGQSMSGGKFFKTFFSFSEKLATFALMVLIFYEVRFPCASGMLKVGRNSLKAFATAMRSPVSRPNNSIKNFGIPSWNLIFSKRAKSISGSLNSGANSLLR